jgi:hypothetical protein
MDDRMSEDGAWSNLWSEKMMDRLILYLMSSSVDVELQFTTEGGFVTVGAPMLNRRENKYESESE